MSYLHIISLCRSLLGFSLALALLVLSAPELAEGQAYEKYKLVASDGAAGNLFGYSVAVSGDVALIGAYRDNDNGTDSGSAYVFRYDSDSGTWGQEDKLLASDGAMGDLFGHSVAASGDVALVGAYRDNDNGTDSGSAYVFRYDSRSGTWSQEDKLVPSDGAAGDLFGFSVAVSGDVALVGAYMDSNYVFDPGSAYVFRYNSGSGTWDQEAKLLASHGAASDYFGWSVAVSGNAALIGVPQDDDNGMDSGSAYVFRYDPGSGTWGQEDKLVPFDGAAGDYFGCAVAVTGDAALIGAYEDDDLDTDSGSAYVFRYNSVSGTWGQEDKLLASDGAYGNYFGCAVAVSGDTALIGAYGDDDYGTDSGSAYMFCYNSGSGRWSQEAKFLPSDGAVLDCFGYSVAVSGGVALSGAFGDDDNGDNSGSAYVFNLTNSLDIKANGEDGNVILHTGEQLTMTLDIKASSLAVGVPKNIWVYAVYVNMDQGRIFAYDHVDNTPSISLNMDASGTYSFGYYDDPVWLPGLTNAYLDEGLFDMTATIMDIPLRTNYRGLWTFWVLLDDKANGAPDAVVDSDTVSVTVLP